MLRTILIALSCAVMLVACSKEEDAPAAKDQPQIAQAQPPSPAVTSDQPTDAPAQPPSQGTASNQPTDAPVQPSNQSVTSDQPKDAPAQAPSQSAESNQPTDPPAQPSNQSATSDQPKDGPGQSASQSAPPNEPKDAPTKSAGQTAGSGHGLARPNGSFPKFAILRPSPRRVVENFYSHFSSGRFDDAIKCLSARLVAAEGGAQKVRAMWRFGNALAHSGWHGSMRMAVEVRKEEYRGQTVLVHALVNKFDGKGPRPTTHRVISEGNGWKIDAIDRG